MHEPKRDLRCDASEVVSQYLDPARTAFRHLSFDNMTAAENAEKAIAAKEMTPDAFETFYQ